MDNKKIYDIINLINRNMRRDLMKRISGSKTSIFTKLAKIPAFFVNQFKKTKHKALYLLLLPSLCYLIIFCYWPLYGIQIAFKDYSSFLGIEGSPWTDYNGFGHFIRFVTAPDFFMLIKNTLSISIVSIIVNTPLPIIFALLLNELKNKYFKQTVQTISYAPYFVSVIVVAGMCFSFLSVGTGSMGDGLLVRFFKSMGIDPGYLMSNENAFLPIYIISGLWQGLGWWSIIYVGALSTVDPALHEAAMIDGAGRMRRIWIINIPAIMPIAIIMLLLSIGQVMNVGFEKVYLLQTAGNLGKSETISTYVYRITLLSNLPQYSYSTAVGLFNTVVNVILLFGANKISSKLGQETLW